MAGPASDFGVPESHVTDEHLIAVATDGGLDAGNAVVSGKVHDGHGLQTMCKSGFRHRATCTVATIWPPGTTMWSGPIGVPSEPPGTPTQTFPLDGKRVTEPGYGFSAEPSAFTTPTWSSAMSRRRPSISANSSPAKGPAPWPLAVHELPTVATTEPAGTLPGTLAAVWDTESPRAERGVPECPPRLAEDGGGRGGVSAAAHVHGGLSQLHGHDLDGHARRGRERGAGASS